jgi:hypothetical protein
VIGDRYRRRRDVLWRRSLDAVILVAGGRAEPMTLSGTGPEVWTLLETPASVTDLADRLASCHKADRHVVEEDLNRVLERLLALGVVELE